MGMKETSHMARYKNPWVLTDRNNSPEYYETKAVPVEHAGCLIYERQDPQTGIPIFDVVLKHTALCVTQMAGINGAKRAAETKEWEQTDWWKARKAKS
jgi:hypothetical protein